MRDEAKSLAQVARVKELLASGKSLKEAVKEVGIGSNTYYKLRNKSKPSKSKAKPRLEHIETAAPSKILAVFCTPEELAHIISKGNF